MGEEPTLTRLEVQTNQQSGPPWSPAAVEPRAEPEYAQPVVTLAPGDLVYAPGVDPDAFYRLAGGAGVPLNLSTFCRERESVDLQDLRTVLVGVLQQVEDEMDARGLFSRVTPPGGAERGR